MYIFNGNISNGSKTALCLTVLIRFLGKSHQLFVPVFFDYKTVKYFYHGQFVKLFIHRGAFFEIPKIKN